MNFFVSSSRSGAATTTPAGGNALGPVKLAAMAPAGNNPGNLKGWCHVPATSTPMPLVVVLHGCTQSAAGYDAGSGWSALAERHGFAVLFPEQQRGNNPNLCFNWFLPQDVRRGSGELLSIREMVAAMIERHGIDPRRVFVTGLSAGGAMASALLAGYPDVFAGGTIIAGLPAGAAGSMPQAFERMRGNGHVDAATSAAYVRDASKHRGPWPTIAVWHGGADATVSPNNAEAILAQWRTLNGVSAVPDDESEHDGAVFRSWRDEDGRICIEDCRIAAMGHGTPIATSGHTACGTPAAFMLDVGISSTWHSAARWGLLDQGVANVAQETTEPAASVEKLEPQASGRGSVRSPAKPTAASLSSVSSPSVSSPSVSSPSVSSPSVSSPAKSSPAVRPAPYDIKATIEAALRTAGLMS